MDYNDGMLQNLYANPEEKLRQLMAWYPNKKLYRRPSAKSGQEIISIYPPDAPCPVYSHDEWYADGWDAPFLEIDLSQSFFDQWRGLQKIAPVVGLLSNRQENAEYCQDVEGLKDCYLVFDSINTRDTYYSVRLYNCKSCVDAYWCMDSELLYECVYLFTCFNCRYSFHCEQTSDSAFLFNCRNTQHSFMSSNLRNKSYYLYNKPVTRDEYEAFMAKINLTDPKQIEKFKQEFQAMISLTPIPSAFLENCENSSGNYLKNSQNVNRGFECFDLKDCFNVFQCAQGKDMMHAFMCNDRVERCFQCVATGIGAYDVKNCAFTWKSSGMEYCYLCISCQDCFGCIGLRSRRYHIFNKPYSKEAYLQKVGELKRAMEKRGEYGKFFSPEFSPFHYEDTIAFDFFEISQTPALGQAIKLIPQELKFYETHGIPKPILPFADRYRERLRLMDTSFFEKERTFYGHPEERKIVSQNDYEKSLK